ncbi:MAG: YceI family protein [Flavobacterium sp.]|nr:YceI family protein [Flavobacterium sp.]
MKNLKTIAIALLVAFGTVNASAQEKKVDIKKSSIAWVGKKVTGQHDGTVSIKDGSLTFKKNKLTGGQFTVDMNTITVNDLKAGQGKEKLEGHLKADDFFGTDKFATATLIFRNVVEKSKGLYTVTGDLTIKGKTNPVIFDMKVTDNTASADVKIDRTKYGIEYKSASIFSGLGDATIYDDFDLNVVLVY